MLEFKLLLFIQGIRFLLFDYKLFYNIRVRLQTNSNSIIKQLLRCPYCQGFWCGFFTFAVYYIYQSEALLLLDIINAFIWGIGSAIISLSWYAIIIPKLDRIEDSYNQE